jgi:hypothetical protein
LLAQKFKTLRPSASSISADWGLVITRSDLNNPSARMDSSSSLRRFMVGLVIGVNALVEMPGLPIIVHGRVGAPEILQSNIRMRIAIYVYYVLNMQQVRLAHGQYGRSLSNSSRNNGSPIHY